MAAGNGYQGVQNRVHSIPTVTHASQANTVAWRHRASEVTAGGGTILERQASYCPSLPPVSRGVLVDLFSGAKEDGRLEADPQSETTQQVYQTSELQNGDIGFRPPLSYQTQMGSVIRPQGCVPPRTNIPALPEMVTFSDKWSGVQVRMPAIRTLHSAQGVYPGGEGSRSIFETPGCQYVSIPGRLAGVRGLSSRDYAPHTASYPGGHEFRLPCELQEVAARSVTIDNVSRGPARPKEGSGHAVPGTGEQPGSMCTHPSGSGHSTSGGLAQSFGFNGQHGGSDSLLSFAHEGNPDPSYGSLQAEYSPCFQDGSLIRPDTRRTQLVVSPTQLDSRNGVSIPADGLCHYNRRVQVRLGRSPPRQPGLRPVDERGSRSPHKSSRVMGRRAHSEVVRSRTIGTQCAGPNGQLHSGSVPEQTRRDKVPDVMCSHHEDDLMVSGTQDHAEGDPHRGCDEHARGRSVQRKTIRSCRDQPVTSGSANHVCQILPPSDRPVCVPQEQTATSVLLPDTRSRGVRGGRSVSELGGNVGVCLPSDLTTTKSSGEGGSRRMLHSSRGSLLAKTRVVSTNGGLACGSSQATPPTTRPAQSGGSREPTAHRAPTVDCMAIIRHRCQEKGFSERTAELVASGRRQSTLTTYSKRLAPYYEWCNERDLDPTRATVSNISQFLTEKFDSGLQSATVRNYKSAIMSIHKGYEDGSSANDGGEIRLLLNGMFNERPPTRKIVPVWELNTVLEYLKGPPFEPMAKASLKNITLKTVMLIALASAHRCSEIHSLSFASMTISRAGATLSFVPGFRAKNETSSHLFPTLFLPSLSTESSVYEDKLWCPVRCLRYYTDRTSSMRGNNIIDQLFITHAEPHKPAAKSTIARWLVQIVVDSKAIVVDERVRAHSTRAIATSWAYHRGLSVKEICEAVSWRSATTFSSAYYRAIRGNSLRGQFARTVLSRTSSTQPRH